MKDSLVLIPFSSPLDNGCDYVLQTLQRVGQQNTVIGVDLNRPYSWKNLLQELLSGQFTILVRHPSFWILQLPFVIPGQRFIPIHRLNSYLAATLLKIFLSFRFRGVAKFLWFFEPYHTPMWVHIFNGYLSLYDCVDYFTHNDRYTAGNEKYIFKHVDVVTVNSHTLWEKHHHKHDQMIRVPVGFPEQLTKKKYQLSPRAKKHPFVVGYIGGINSRLNFPLIEKIIRALPTMQFRFIGTVEKEGEWAKDVAEALKRLQKFPNFELLPPVPKAAIPTVIASFDVGIIPYDLKQHFNRYSNPMKLYDYFYFQLPVVSVPITELAQYDTLVSICTSSTAWVRTLKHIQKHGHSKATQTAQRRVALQNTWKLKIKAIYHHLETLQPAAA